MAVLKNRFFSGDHQGILAVVYDAGKRPPTADLPWIIGSLSFVGRIEEAAALYQTERDHLSAPQKSASLFFLGVGFCRHSQYDQGKGYFFENARIARATNAPEQLFFAHQGLAFWRYFQSRFALAQRQANRALMDATQARFPYGQCLALELLGYAEIQNGQIRHGLKQLERALAIATQLGHGSWEQAMRVSLVCYEAQFGFKPKTILNDLKHLSHKMTEQNSFSRSAVLLELARQLTLRGRIAESETVLSEACRIIYGLRHKRHGVLLNLRYAENRFHRGEYFDALNLIRASRSDLDPKIDHQLMISLLGMEKKLCAALGLPFSGEELAAQTRRHGSWLSKRMLSRLAPKGLDPLGDEIDNPEAVEEYPGLYLKLLPATLTPRALFLREKSLIARSHGNTVVLSTGVTDAILSLLRTLKKETTKETLVRELWGYDYHPIRHDSLVYRLVTRTRQLLGSEDWVVMTPNGYRLDPRVTLCEWGNAAPMGGTNLLFGRKGSGYERGFQPRRLRLY